MGSAGVASTHLGRLEGQPGAGAGRKPLKAPGQPYETQPLCLFTRETILAPEKATSVHLSKNKPAAHRPECQALGQGKNGAQATQPLWVGGHPLSPPVRDPQWGELTHSSHRCQH